MKSLVAKYLMTKTEIKCNLKNLKYIQLIFN
jgi:hypothetical protein